MNLRTIVEGLTTIVAALSGVPVGGEENQSEQFADDTTRAEFSLRVVSSTSRGIGAEVRARRDLTVTIPGDLYTPAAGAAIYSARGNRRLVIDLKFESGVQVSDADAPYYAERVRDRLCLPSVRASFAALGVALAETGPLRVTQYDDPDGRPISVGMFELRLNAASDVDDDPITTIEVVTPTITGTA